MNLTQVTFFISGQIAQPNTVSASLPPVPLQRVSEGASVIAFLHHLAYF